MDFKVREAADGQFEIVLSMPVVIGTFVDKDMASKVMRLLIDDALAECAAPPKADETRKPASSILPSKAGLEEVEDDWTAPELEEAYARLIAGEKVTDVAVSFGKSWTVLRAKWASQKKSMMAPDSSLDLEECRLCGREFKPSAAAQDICARCARG